MSKKLGTVVIGGGTGFIGQALTKLLKCRGYEVFIVSRKPGVNRITWGDLAKEGLPKCEAVISLSGQNVLDPKRRWTPGFQQNVYASRVNTTKALAHAISTADKPPKVFVTISGVGYYKPSSTEEYTEASQGGDFDFLSRLCTDWEEASELLSESAVRRVVIRSGVVLGRYGGLINQVFIPFYLGLGGRMGPGTQFMPWIHIADVAKLFLHAIENDDWKGVFNGVAPHVITNAEFVKSFARHLWRPAFFPLPTFALNLAFSEERAKMITEGQRVIPKRTLESGYKFMYPDIDSACKEFCRLIYADDHIFD